MAARRLSSAGSALAAARGASGWWLRPGPLAGSLLAEPSLAEPPLAELLLATASLLNRIASGLGAHCTSDRLSPSAM